MEVLDENAAFLSNYEVYELLKEKKQQKDQPKNVATVSYETVQYLEKLPCQYQNAKVIQGFLEALKPFNLTRAEKLQLLNLRPTSVVELNVIVEELDERLQSEEKIEELLTIITEKLPMAEEAADEHGEPQT